MRYSAQYHDFLQDKNRFFNALATRKLANTKAVRQDAFSHNFQFTATNLLFIEEERDQLAKSLKSSRKKREEFWLYCYYLTIMLESYYKAYNQANKAAEYHKLRRQLWYHCKKVTQPQASNKDAAIKKLGKALARDVGDIAVTPIKIARLRQQIGFYNLFRISLLYSRLALASSLHWLEGSPLLLQLEKLLHHSINVKQLIATLDNTVKVFRPLSVGFFITRFLLHASTAFKHLVHPSKYEKELAFKQRLYNELYKRHPDMIRDGIWAIVNGLTNYAHILHIPLHVAGALSALFLVLDVGLVIWCGYLAQREYLVKKAQYMDERKQCFTKLQGNLSHEEQVFLTQNCELLSKQLTQLEINWHVKNYAMWFNIAAGLILAAGFAASLLFTAPAVVISCYFACLLATAMCLSTNDYSRYCEKSLQLQQAQINDHTVDEVKKEYRQARNSFALTMIKYILVPSLLITTFAFSWQASLVLLVLYLGYELYCATRANRSSPAPVELPPMQDIPVETESEESSPSTQTI